MTQTREYKNKLYRKAWVFNRKKYRKYVIKTIKNIERDLSKEAKKGKYNVVLTTNESRFNDHYLNTIAFRWLLRHSKYKPVLKDEEVFVSKEGKRYTEMMQIKFDWNLSNGHVY